MTDGTEVASPILTDGAATYTPGLSEHRGTASKFYHSDALGSTRGITNSSQSVTDSTLFDAFGMTVSHSGTTATPFGFVGGSQYQTDNDSGLILLGHRYYDASIGRFISSDPAHAGDNWYAYCDNNPLVRTDATGLDDLSPFEQGLIGAGAVIGGFLGGLAGATGGSVVGPGGTVVGAVEGAGTGVVVGTAAATFTIGLVHGVVHLINQAASHPPRNGWDPGRTHKDDLPIAKDGTKAVSDPRAEGPHTTIGTRTEPSKSPEPYQQGITYDEQGNPVGRTDVTDHGRFDHGNPHWHPWNGKSFTKGPHPMPPTK